MAGNRILYFYLLLLSLLFFVLFDLYLFHLLFVFLLLLPLVSLLAVLPCRHALRCTLEAEDDIVPKGSGFLRLVVKNGSPFPCACVRIRIERKNALGRADGRYPDAAEEAVQLLLGPRRTETLRPAVRMAHCGRMDFSIRRIDVYDMLGLFSIPAVNKKSTASACSIYVLPALQSRTVAVADTADLGLDSATYSKEKPGGDPSEVFALRDYRPGDPQHSIHWKLSSRMDRLIVREFSLPLNPSLHFLLELRAGASPVAAEAMLGAMLAFSEYLMTNGIAHHISWIGEQGALRTVSVTGADTLAAALHELLALPGETPWRALSEFSLRTVTQTDASLFCLVAGGTFDASEDAGALRILQGLLDRRVCRRVTLMPDRCPEEAALRFRALGCMVEPLDGSLPGAETEAAL